jgi:tetratricopeptide (TPR) repeat protein
MAVVVTALWIASRTLCGDAFMVDHHLSQAHQHSSQCFGEFAAQRWLDASVDCTREAKETGDSAFGVRAAGALLNLGHTAEALASAQRWYGSNDNATARQIAGAVYFRRDELALAIPFLEVALVEHVQRHDHEEAAHDEQYLAGALMHAGLLGDAVDAAEAAVWEADLTSVDDTHVQLRGRARRALGKIMMEIGNFSTARTMLWKAQQVLLKWPDDQAWVFLQLGMLQQAIDDHASAAIFFERTLEFAANADVPWVTTSARLNLAYSRRELGDLDAAEFQMSQLDQRTRDRPTALFVTGLIAADRGQRELAEQLLARAAADAPTDDYASDIALQRGRIAERASDLTAAEHYYRTAIAHVEKLRLNTHSLAWRPWVLARRRDPYRRLLSLLAGQDRRVEALVVAEQLHARAWFDALVDRTEASGVRAQVSFAMSLGRQLRAHAAGALSSDEILALLRGRDALVFSETESDIWRFHIADGKVAQLDRLPDQTRSWVEQWRKAPNDRTILDKLGVLLIPSAARVPSPRPLYIVTNDTLNTLPFAALRPEGRFLIEDRVISRLPGIVVLRCRTRPQILRSSVFLGDSRDDLDDAREETIAFARSLGGTAFVGADATVERLEESRDAALLHLAIHAEVDQAGARLLLANQQQVTASDIVEHAIGPRVAVLSGCATAVGRNRDPEGWGALSSAFLVAGSRSVVATLQSVTDPDAREIMQRFYSHGGDRQPAIALAQAQRELLAADPSMWGVFVVYGSADPADCEASP